MDIFSCVWCLGANFSGTGTPSSSHVRRVLKDGDYDQRWVLKLQYAMTVHTRKGA